MGGSDSLDQLDGIAIIGMACRFPGAKSVDEFWRNLQNGVESISVLSDQEMEAMGVDPALLKLPNFVKAGPVLEDIELFDASFFEVNAREAEAMDPQQRIFLECAWQVLENAGYDPERYAGRIGVYAGAAMNSYLLSNLMAHRDFLAPLGDTIHIVTVNDKDYLCTRISYKLNLKGPSVTVQSACSTSLVAAHLACESLLNGECDMALAGGATVRVPQLGYPYQQGGIQSPDGRCRAFDANARGTIFGGGVGVVALKRLAEALRDGDWIHAVIKGSAINNDGSRKVGYTAPSVDGQASVIAEALEVAGIEPETITYVETHGTGTELGDPIEIAALTQAFRRRTEKKGFCAIGSVKTNIGHPAAAAGVAGLIKTTLTLEHKMIPPSLNFEQPNPKIDFENSPFYVNTRLAEWKAGRTPRRAGLSSFGMGGTNAHAVLEEAPQVEPSGESRPWQLLLLSAKTATALETATVNLAEHLKQQPDINLADVAYTLQVGRKALGHRRMLVCRGIDEAVNALETLDPKRVSTDFREMANRPVVFMFTGQGAQYVNMGWELYQVEPTFREQVDRCSELLAPHLGFDLRDVLYPSTRPSVAGQAPNEERVEEAAQRLEQTAIAQPALFVIEYSLARLWMEWGLQPQAMVGHSIGEYVAACLAGVFSLEEGLALVAARGRLMQQMPGGAMLAVPLPEEKVRPLLNGQLALAVMNGPSDCIVSGAAQAVEALQNQLADQGIACRRLHTSHAFHSSMMEPILKPFTEQVSRVNLEPPQIPYLSNTTGDWITAAEATDPEYWSRHLLQTVRFADNLQQLSSQPEQILLEVGPGRTLTTFATRHPARATGQVVLASLRHPQDRQSDVAFLLTTLGRLWLAGAQVNWLSFSAHERRHRLPLPTYPFERQRYWLEPAPKASGARTSAGALPVAPQTRKDIADWFYIPSWKRSVALARQPGTAPVQSNWLVFADECGLASQLVKELERQSQNVIAVREAAEFGRLSDHDYTLNPRQPNDYDTLLGELFSRGELPKTIVHLWSVTQDDQIESRLEEVDRVQDVGFYSLLFLAQALGRQNLAKFQIMVVSNNMQQVTERELRCPHKATVLGPVRVIPKEYPNISCRSVDIAISESGMGQTQNLTEILLAEITAESTDPIVAYRGNHRWVQIWEPIRLDGAFEKAPRLREEGVYLITGGLGGIGLVLAEHLAKSARAKLILTGRSAFPGREKWEKWLASHADQDSVSRKILKLRELEELGSEILVVSADTARREQMEAAVAQASARFGRIHGVIHAAGVPAGGVIQRKTRDAAESILLPKVKGTLILDALLGDAPLDFFVLCSSITSVLGLFGQVDYCAANAFLDAFAHHRAYRDGGATTSINWGAWQEVGMAVEAARQATGTLDIPTPAPHPLLDQRITEDSSQEIYVTHLSVAKHWALHEHRIMGKATLPATTYLEMVQAAFKNHARNGTIEIQDVCFLTPLVVEENEEKQVHTVLTKQEDGFAFVIKSRSDFEWQEHVKGKLVHTEAEPPEKYPVQEIEAECNEQEIVMVEGEHKSRTGFMDFGPRWGNLRRVKLGQNQGLATLELPEAFAADVQLYELHPALMDIATSFLLTKFEGAYLPFSYKRLSIKGPLPKKIYSYARCLEGALARKGNPRFDITIMDDQGTALVEIEDYTLLAVSKDGKAETRETEQAASPFATSHPSAPVLSSMGSGSHEKTSARTKALQKELVKEGLLPAEGVDAFNRILWSRLPQVLVSPYDLLARVEQRHTPGAPSLPKALEEAALSRPAHPRPELRNTYVAPRNEFEQALADIWKEFLRIERIGVHDNFFELGADSLLATQVISRIREAFQVDLPVASLFEEPTVAGLAKLIESPHWAAQVPPSPDRVTTSDREQGEI